MRTDNQWRHSSGWEARHCGHRTAIHPYYLVDPATPEDTIVSHNGYGFGSIYVARRAVELIVEGVLEASSDQCTPGTRRVLERIRSAA